MKGKVPVIIKIVIGVLLIVTDIITYFPAERQYLLELTCISNFTIGLVFLISGIQMAKGKKDFPNVIYETAMVTISLVFIVCIGSLFFENHFNFRGGFIFLHVINPIIILVYYFVFINEKVNRKRRDLLFCPLFALTYLFFDYVIGSLNKKYVYEMFQPGDLHPLLALLAGVGMYGALLLYGLGMFGLNRSLHKK